MADVAPQHLTRASKAWVRAIRREFVLNVAQDRVLVQAAEAWDRVQGAREVLAVEGLFYGDRWGKPRLHPAALLERDSRQAFAKLVKDLALPDAEPDGRVVGR